MAAIIVGESATGPLGKGRLGKRATRRLGSSLGAVGLLVLCGSVWARDAWAQDPAPAAPSEAPAEAQPPAASAEGAAAEQAPADPAVEEPAVEDPSALPPDDGTLEVGTGDVGAEAAAGEGDLEEVVVTVDRRKKDLQDYSGVAASFSESKLASIGITNAREMASMVPGLQIGTQEGNTEVYIRGVGSDNNTELGDPAVSLHVDGVYIPRPRGVGSMFFDIERVEVNSGPQGTLRGRNSMGGSVNIVSARPKLGEFGANGEATFGTFAQRRYQGMVNIPIGDTLAFRVAGFSEVHDPYFVNAGPVYDITPGENADAYALRAQVLYQPVKALSLLFGYDMTRERGTGYLGANFQGPLTATDTTGALIGPNGMPSSTASPVTIPFAINDLDNPRRVYYRGMNPSTDLIHQGLRGEVTFDTGPVIFQALASYRALRYQQVTGANAGAVTDGYGFDDVSPDVYTNGFWDTRSQSLIGELRAFAPDTARLRWTAGGFFFDEDQQVFAGQISDPANGFGGGEFNMPDVKGGSIAGYVDATFDVVDSFRAIGGARLTHEEKSRNGGLWALAQNFPGGENRFGTEGYKPEGLSRTQYGLPQNADGTPIDTVENRVNLFLNGVDSFGARDTLPQALCNDPPAATPGQVQQPRVAPNEDGVGMYCTAGVRSGLSRLIYNTVPQNNETKNTFFDWRLGVEFDATKDSLLYFTVTTGHKAGGFNDTAPGIAQNTLYNSDYDPESVLSFELGSKNVLLDRNLRLNASAFMYRYDDLTFQTIVGLADPAQVMDGENANQAAPNSAVRQNAQTTTPIYGLDIDATYRLPAGLEAEVHVLLMDAKFQDGTITTDTRLSDNPANNYKVDLGGNWLPRVSPYTINYTLSQLIFTEFGSFNWVIQGQTRGKHYMSVYNGEGNILEPDGVAPTTALYTSLLANETLQQRFTDVVPTYTRFDIGAGWKHPDGRISLNAFLNNVGNIAYSTSIISTSTLNLRFFNPPRTAGVRFRVDW